MPGGLEDRKTHDDPFPSFSHAVGAPQGAEESRALPLPTGGVAVLSLMSGFTKLFSSIVTSSVWAEPDHVRLVWITMLATADQDGIVEASIPGLANLARVDMERAQAALEVLQAPDKWSRTKTDEGRRIEPVAGGWRLLNHALYRKKLSAEDRREYKTRKQREYRAVDKNSPPLSTVSTNGQSGHIASVLCSKDREVQEGKEIPETLKTPEFLAAWTEWTRHRREIRKPLKPTSTKAQLRDLAEMGVQRAIAAIRYTISKGWQGIREPSLIERRSAPQTSQFEFQPAPDPDNAQ